MAKARLDGATRWVHCTCCLRLLYNGIEALALGDLIVKGATLTLCRSTGYGQWQRRIFFGRTGLGRARLLHADATLGRCGRARWTPLLRLGLGFGGRARQLIIGAIDLRQFRVLTGLGLILGLTLG